jgi:hypothetical protein
VELVAADAARFEGVHQPIRLESLADLVLGQAAPFRHARVAAAEIKRHDHAPEVKY